VTGVLKVGLFEIRGVDLIRSELCFTFYDISRASSITKNYNIIFETSRTQPRVAVAQSPISYLGAAP
jgi:hypothetical protein